MTDKSDYARCLGYQGNKPVQVRDGRVISHRNVDWVRFCELLRQQNKGQS